MESPGSVFRIQQAKPTPGQPPSILALIASADDGNVVPLASLSNEVGSILDSRSVSQTHWCYGMQEYQAEALGRRYRFSLALVAVLVLLNQALVEPSLVRLTADASLINVAGRQRMLSQWLAKTALASDRTRDLEGRDRSLQELDVVLGLWTTSHENLRRGVIGRSIIGGNSPSVQAGLDDLEPHYQKIREASMMLIRSNHDLSRSSGPLVADPLEVILGQEAAYLRKMEAVVALYEREARGRINQLRWIGWGLTGLILLALLAIGQFIFRPADRLIRRQIKELQLAKDDLESRVRERTQELESARQRHQALLEQFSHVGRTSTLGEMASGLAHELNQPLGAIANYAEGCLNALQSPQPALDEVRQALERLTAATSRAGRIIKQIRRFVTRHKPTMEPFDPNQAVSEVLEILEFEARQRGIPIQLDLAPGLPYVWGDPVQIQQVLMNLVRNALDSLGQPEVIGPKVVISNRQTAQGDVEFLVTDNGEGIAPDQIDRVFDAYYSTRAEGMGMGLAICRSIVEAHQGCLQLESKPGIQTTFRLTLLATGGDVNDAGLNGLHRG